MPRRAVASRAGMLCAVVLALAAVAPSTARPLRARTITFEGAEGAWLERRGDDVFLYFVFAFRSQKALKQPHTRLFADRSRCRVHRVRGKLVASCLLEGRVERIRSERFEVDPRGARLRTREHRVTWRGRGLPALEVEPWVDTAAVLADAYVERRARAWGKVFDRKVTRRSLDRGVLFKGIDAGVLTDLDGPVRTVRSKVRIFL